MLFTLLLMTLILNIVKAGEPVPQELRQKLKTASSFGDFMKMANVELTKTPYRERKLLGGSLYSLASTRPGASTKKVNDDLSLLNSIKQGTDTCVLQNICVPVPVDTSNPEVLVFPRCYEVNQCVGACCDAAESCHPTAKEYVYKPVVEMVYSGNNKFEVSQTQNITMEQHLACSCRDCSTEANRCTHKHILGPSCTCMCKNSHDKAACTGNRRWSEDSCTCICPLKTCPRRRFLNQKTCACERLLRFRADQPDRDGNFKPDTSKLPSLRLKKRTNSKNLVATKMLQSSEKVVVKEEP